ACWRVRARSRRPRERRTIGSLFGARFSFDAVSARHPLETARRNSRLWKFRSPAQRPLHLPHLAVRSCAPCPLHTEPAMLSRRLAAVAALLLAVPALAADPAPDTSRGDRMLDAYFRRQTKDIADACLADVKTKADWEKKRPELRRQFLEMMGLWPLPQRTDLKPVVTGTIDAELFTIEKLHFQSLLGLYVTANLYVPKKAKFPAPAV